MILNWNVFCFEMIDEIVNWFNDDLIICSNINKFFENVFYFVKWFDQKTDFFVRVAFIDIFDFDDENCYCFLTFKKVRNCFISKKKYVVIVWSSRIFVIFIKSINIINKIFWILFWKFVFDIQQTNIC